MRAILWLGAMVAGMTAQGAEPLTDLELLRLAKPATALVSFGTEHAGTAFCIDSSGLFLTTHLLAAGSQESGDQPLLLTLDVGLESQRTFTAKLLDTDIQTGFALLGVDPTKPLQALELGSAAGAVELSEVMTFGYPDPARDGSPPPIAVRVVRVSSLQKTAGSISGFRLDTPLLAGHAGGPVLDRKGKVIGMLLGDEKRLPSEVALPTERAWKFLEDPIVRLAPEPGPQLDLSQPIEFRARLFGPQATGAEYTLLLRNSHGKPRQFPMKLAGEQHAATVVPLQSAGPLQVHAKLEFEHGQLKGMVVDQELKLGDQTIRLKDLASITPGARFRAVRRDGTALEVESKALSLPVQVADQTLQIDLATAVRVELELPTPNADYTYSVVVTRAEQQVGRFEGVLQRVPHNILVIMFDQLTEYAPTGKLIRRIDIPDVGDNPHQFHTHDLTVDRAGRVFVVNGYGHPVLSEYSGGNWQHHQVAEWTIVNVSSQGGVARFQDELFVLGRKTLSRATDGSKDEVLRFRTHERTWQRWPTKPYYGLTLGYDGLLYTHGNGMIDVYDPETFTLKRSIRSPRNSYAVNEQGEFFAVSAGGLISHLNPDGSVRNEVKVADQLKDIALSPSGQIAIGSHRGNVYVTDETLAYVTSFSAGQKPTWVTFGSLPDD